ncbi:MAG: 50S ribosomal protein L2 [Bacteroidota bacterium]
MSRSNSSNNLKYLKPINASSRGVVLINKKHLWKGRPYGPLTVRIKNTGGRNNLGRITTQGIGGGSRRMYRKVDFHRKKQDVNALVERIEYDPNRTAFIALIKYQDGEISYILAPDKLKVGDTIVSGKEADILPGNCLKLFDIPMGTLIHNIELQPGKGGQIARAAGTFASLSGKEQGYAILRLPSGELRKVSLDCKATVGILSNLDLFNENLGKAGRTRLRGRKQKVRGRARNPVDHHNGGRNAGKVLASSNGNVIKGKVSRNKKKASSKLIIARKCTRRS